MAPAALADCEPKRVFDGIARQTEAVLALRAASNPKQFHELEKAIAQFDGLNIRASLQSNDMGGYIPLLYRVLADIRAMVEDGAVSVADVRRTDLGDVKAVLNRLCEESDGAKGETNKQRQLPQLDQVLSTFQFGDTAGADEEFRSYLMLGSLPFIVFVTCSIIFVLLKLYRYSFSFIYLRRKCRIPAALHVGPLVIGGHVTILGAKGNRFEASDGAEITQMTQYLKGLTGLPDTSITIGDTAQAARLHLVNAPVCVTFFDRHLSRGTLRHLFGQSQTQVRFVPKTATLPNLHRINPMLKASEMRR